MTGSRHRWLVCASADGVLCAGLGVLLGWPALYVLAPLSFPAWAWLDGSPEGKALLDRLFGG